MNNTEGDSSGRQQETAEGNTKTSLPFISLLICKVGLDWITLKVPALTLCESTFYLLLDPFWDIMPWWWKASCMVKWSFWLQNTPKVGYSAILCHCVTLKSVFSFIKQELWWRLFLLCKDYILRYMSCPRCARLKYKICRFPMTYTLLFHCQSPLQSQSSDPQMCFIRDYFFWIPLTKLASKHINSHTHTHIYIYILTDILHSWICLPQL